MKYSFFLLLTLFVAFCPDFVQANERKFSFTYETSVLPKGAREIELWNTDRRGRSYFYRRLDQRIEYEFGVSANLMAALYLNYSWRVKDSNGDAAGGTKSTSYAVSVSNEWKYKLMDRVADPFGFALYGEWTAGPDKNEVEGKLLFDKQVNDILVAFNAVAEQEWSYGIVNGETEVEKEFITEFDFGVTYDVTEYFSVGVEARQHAVYIDNEQRHSSLFAGPTVAVSTEYFWAVLTVMPQVKSFKGATTHNRLLDLGEYEKVQTRLLFSFHL